MKHPIQQAKEHLLKNLRQHRNLDVEEIVYPCLPQDLADFRSALELIEVQAEFNRRGVKARIIAVSKTGEPLPDIVIATVDDAASGKVDKWFKTKYGM